MLQTKYYLAPGWHGLALGKVMVWNAMLLGQYLKQDGPILQQQDVVLLCHKKLDSQASLPPDTYTPSMAAIDLCLYAAATPPSGQTSNFTDPPNMASAWIGVTTIMIVFVTIATALRITAYHKDLKWSDYCCMVALVTSLGQAGLMYPQTRYARYIWDVPVCWLLEESYPKILFSQTILFVASQISAKLSLLLLFLDIFNVNSTMKKAIYTGMLAAVLVYLPSIPVQAYYFVPSHGQTWSEVFISGKNDNAMYWGIVQSVLASMLDIYLFALPLPVLSRLNMSSKKRTQVVAVFSMALLGLVANLLSLVFRALEYEHIHSDSLWYTCALLICSIAEVNIAIIVSSLPGVNKFARLYGSKWSWPRLPTSLRYYSFQHSGTSREKIVQNKGKTSMSADSDGRSGGSAQPSLFNDPAVVHARRVTSFSDVETAGHASLELQSGWENAIQS
ncbi:hypothetical protein BD289DRAFT_5082 [Coniella lustricola]|uniref:Rhodopsin domain-containing protein n=1 Tax=Coniella lustricola TaxID=2025994 RepID=A0A2T3ANS3_9PEZI|nr:hypothetical protein BD289DRAFT_5082 [Coniella lustricola]